MLDPVDSTQQPNNPEATDPPVVPASPESSQLATQQDLSRLRRLLWVFSLLFAVLVAPYVVGKIQYALVAAEERAKIDIAREAQRDFNLSHFSTAGRLLAQQVGPSVVNITTHRRRGLGQGSGVIVDGDGYIVTNNHVVEGIRTVEIQLSDGRSGPATVVGTDPLVDIAVLKTELDGLYSAEWGDSDELDVGEIVWAIGSPFGLEESITFGILSAKGRRGVTARPEFPGRRGVRRPRDSVYQEYLQTDAAVNPGNSGGPWIDVYGRIVGINTAIIGDSYQGISFAIPSSIARESYQQLRENGSVERGYLGVQPSKTTAKIARELDLEQNEGVLVLQVQEDTPASAAGLEVGDVILNWDGTEFSDPTLMSRAIAATPIGETVPVEIVRAGPHGPRRMTLKVKVGTRPPDSL